MKRGHKKLMIICGMIILLAHFLFLVSYVFKPGKYSVFYAYPYFHQNWNLFVPPPHNNYNLYAFYENNGRQSVDIFKELLVKHQSNRFGGSEALLIALGNSIHYFEKESTPDVSGNNFKMIEKFAKHYLNHTRKINLSEIHLILAVDRNNPAETRIYSNIN